MSERNYYVLCDSNCKFPAMTKEQVLSAIAEATGNTPSCVNDAFISKLKEQNRGNACTVWIGTQAEYNALDEIIPDCLYYITDETTLEDINRALVAMGANVDDAVKAMTAANAKMLADVNEVVEDMTTDTDEKINADRERLAALEAVEELTVTEFLRLGASITDATRPSHAATPDASTVWGCSGNITFRRQGHICTATFDLNVDLKAGQLFLFYANQLDIPEKFRPSSSAFQIGLLHDENITYVNDAIEMPVYINNSQLKILIKEKVSSSTIGYSAVHYLVGTLTYFV